MPQESFQYLLFKNILSNWFLIILYIIMDIAMFITMDNSY